MPPLPQPQFQPPPPPTSSTLLTFPTPQILLIILNRPRQLNCINIAGHHELHAIFTWFDNEPSLRVAIITGAGRAFCAGMDLKEALANSAQQEVSSAAAPSSEGQAQQRHGLPRSGFGGLSRRRGKKPVIAAVNGLAHGGGCEMVTNADIVLASPQATFAFPEVKRGVAAIAGALPRLSRVVGRQRAMEMVLLGRTVGVEEARGWGLVNAVAGGAEGRGEGKGKDGGKGKGVVDTAIEWAREIAEVSPDSVVVSKEGVQSSWDGYGVEEATERLEKGVYRELVEGENYREGLRAFVEKRSPRWRDSKL